MSASVDLLTIPIATDARLLVGGTGVSTYARALTHAITQVSGSPLLLETRPIANPAWRWINAVRPGLRRLAYNQDKPVLSGDDIFRNAHVHFSTWGTLFRLTSDIPPGIMHWTYPVPMIIEGWVNLYTVHDVIPMLHPELTPIRARRYRAVLRRLQAEATRFVTVSQSAQSSIISALGCDADFVVNASQSVDVANAPMAPIPHSLQRKGYFLVVGSLEPRKNVVALLAAYRRSGTTLPLVLVGPDGWQAAPILQAIADTPGATRIPYQTRAQLLGLIDGARSLLFPSLAEGFGLPIIEAMALGTAVMTSHEGALAEIAGGAALLVNPYDETAMAETIGRLANDDPLVARLIACGLLRAAAFSAPLFAQRLRSIYQDALRNIRPDDRE